MVRGVGSGCSVRTSGCCIFAIDDVNGLSLLDSAAVVQARVAVDAILGGKSRFSARWVPRCIHTDPSIASVGWNEDEAGKAGLDLIAHSQTFRLLTDDEKSVVDPGPTMLKILVNRSRGRSLAFMSSVVKLPRLLTWPQLQFAVSLLWNIASDRAGASQCNRSDPGMR